MELADNFTAEDFAKWLRKGKGLDPEQNEWDWEDTARGFGVSYVVLGSLAIVLNSTFLYTLLARRRTTFSHVFYIMILNFTLIDTIKGVCSILFAIKLLKSDMSSSQSLWTVRIDQYSGVLLRFSNLATILNLLMITMNEYIFICYPLRYPSLITRGRVMFFVVATWIIASTFTLANMVMGIQNRSIMIDTECSLTANSTSSCILHFDSSTSSHFAYHLGLIVFCLLCLAATGYSYVILLGVISTVVKADMKYNEEMEKLQERKGSDRRVDNKHILKRHKYVVVIGTVIVVYSAYLTTYAVIQGLALVNMSQNLTGVRKRGFMYLKYICYLFISLHSLLQPLCYLRMREFRTLIKRTLCGRFRRESVLSEHMYLSSQSKDGRGGGSSRRPQFL